MVNILLISCLVDIFMALNPGSWLYIANLKDYQS